MTHKYKQNNPINNKPKSPNKRKWLKTIAASATLATTHKLFPIPHSAAAEPIKIGLQWHGTGIGAAYGKWYKKTAEAATNLINTTGGINNKQIILLTEDDATNPKRGNEIIHKLSRKLKCDAIFGSLFSHVVIASAQAAGELKIPYFVCSEGHHVASGILNRYTLQPGITDVKSQIISVAPWITQNLGKKITMIFPDYAFGYDHRDNLTQAIKNNGGNVIKHIAIPPTENSFTKYFPQIPKQTEVLYHVMVGPAVLTFARELGQFYGSRNHPELFGFIDSLESVNINSPGLEFLQQSHFWEGHPRYLQKNHTNTELLYRKNVEVNENGASIHNENDVSAYGHMFSCWETLFVIKQAMETCNYQSTKQQKQLIETIESFTQFPYGIQHPQGKKEFNGKTHQAFGEQYITQLQNKKLIVKSRLPISAGYYPDEVDYTQHPF